MPRPHCLHVLYLLVQVYPGPQGRPLEDPHSEPLSSGGACCCQWDYLGPLDVTLILARFGRVHPYLLQEVCDSRQVHCAVRVATVSLVQNHAATLLSCVVEQHCQHAGHIPRQPPSLVRHCLWLADCSVWPMIMITTSFAISSSVAMGRVSSSVRTTGRLRMGTCCTNLSTGSIYPRAPVLLPASLRVHRDNAVSYFIVAVSMPDLPGARGSRDWTALIHTSIGKSRLVCPAP